MADPFRLNVASSKGPTYSVPLGTNNNIINVNDNNKESIINLKNNIELLFTGFNICGQFALYPLRVIRWQCQIHSESQRYHLTPFTLIPVLFNLKNQGYTSLLWKGCFSMSAFNALTSTLENIIAEVTPLEKSIKQVNKSSKLHGPFIIKFLSYAITTPIYTAVIYESIQTGISSESLGINDLARETWNRITGYRYTYRTRLIPFYSLILPTSFYFIGMHLLSSLFEKFYLKMIVSIQKLLNERRHVPRVVDEIEQEVVEQPYTQAVALFASNLTSLIVMYPVETILNRLIVQGTRTIIDNTDYGYGVIPINTRYDGFFDCLKTIEHTEGLLGLYKGLGSALLEGVLTFGLLKLAKLSAYCIYDTVWISRNDSKSSIDFLTQQNAFISSNQQRHTHE